MTIGMTTDVRLPSYRPNSVRNVRLSRAVRDKNLNTISRELLQSVISELVKRYVVMNQRRDNDDMTSPTS